MTETYHLPATEVSASFGVGNALATWRYATKLEVEHLWKHAGVQDIGSGLASTANVSAVLALQDMVGFWYRSDGRAFGNPARYRVTAAFLDDPTLHQPVTGRVRCENFAKPSQGITSLELVVSAPHPPPLVRSWPFDVYV